MFKYILKYFLQTICGKPLPPLSAAEATFLSELKTIFHTFQEMDTTKVVPSEAAWYDNMNRLKKLVLKQNPRKFLQWDVVMQTMFVSFAHYIFTERTYLKRHKHWSTRWHKVIHESPVG